jgi:hypothetical protein
MSISAAQADDISDQITQASEAYAAGDFTGAKQALDTASQLISQKNAEGYAALLPAPLDGWRADESQSNAGAAVFGVTSASRSYVRESDEASVEIAISGDTAMLSPFLAALSNPVLAGSMGKLITLGKFRAIAAADGGDLQIGVANKFLVSITGSAGTEDKIAYAKAMDLAKLAGM